MLVVSPPAPRAGSARRRLELLVSNQSAVRPGLVHRGEPALQQLLVDDASVRSLDMREKIARRISRTMRFEQNRDRFTMDFIAKPFRGRTHLLTFARPVFALGG